MIKYTSRRSFLGAIGTASTTLLAGCMGSKPQVSDSTFVSQHEDINISLFQTERIYNINETIQTPLNTLKLCKKYIEREFSKLGTDVQVNVNIIESSIEKFTDRNGYDAYEDWIKYFEKSVPEKHKSRDSNILLTNISNNTNFNGLGELPCSCRNRNTVGITFNPSTLALYDNENIDDEVYKKEFLEQNIRPLATIIHEVGHNIGFSHDMGYGWYDESNEVIKSTPMLGSYITNEEYFGKENYFGDKIVNYEEYDSISIKIVPSINPKLTHNEVVYEYN